MAVVTVPKVLREKLSDEGADALVELINKADEKQKEDTLKFLEEKFEAKLSIVEEKFERRLSEEIGKVRVELSKEIAETKASLRNEIAETRAALEVKIESVKSEIIKWMFIFWIGQFAAIVGTLTAILFAFFRK